MSDVAEILHVNIVQEITVSLPGTKYSVTYPRPNDPRSALVSRPFAWQQDERAAMTPSEFLNRAHHTATQRALELGWIK